jgi:D-alanyl-D-alanine carboxypeptidase (penicillin-binding protein 5/6)
MSRSFFNASSHHRSRKLWQPLAALVMIIAIIALVLLYGKRIEATPMPITSPNPIATSTPLSPEAFMGINLMGQSAIVYDLTTGQTLYSQNADRQLPLASLTKLLTTYAGLDTLGPNATVGISSSSLAVEGESGLAEGETFLFSDLARFALVGSSNDAAEAMAEAVAAKRGQSVGDALSAEATGLGLTKTYAVNGSGLDVSPTAAGGYGSARDIALLAGALLKKAPGIAAATTEPSVFVRSTSGTPHSLPNTNQGAITVPGILLSKTGFTDLAGGNLVVVFDVGIGHPVAVTVLGSSRDGRFIDVNRLIDATHQYFAGITQ